MTATLAASTAILKVRYPDGKLPKPLYLNFKATSMVKKRTDFTGDYRVVALQNENPQGSGTSVPAAQNALQQSAYNRFQVTRVEHFGIARIKGQALKAAEGDAGALTDLWDNETKSIARVELMNHEIYTFGAGNGVLGTVGSYTAGTTSFTLAVPSDAAKFALGMTIQAATGTSTSLSLTLVGGGASGKISGIDRVNGIITATSNWDTLIPGFAATNLLGRASDLATAGIPSVIMGMGGWIVGGTSPGTLYGLNRNVDPVRLAGQLYPANSVPLEEAVQEASALAAQQGGIAPKTLWCHVRDFANLKKSLGTKVTYPKTSVKGSGDMAGVGFSGVEIEGDSDTITLMTSPFIARNQAFLVDWDSFTLDSAGAAPFLANFDGVPFLRLNNDDAYEVRFASYAAMYTNNPVSCVQLTGFGA